MLVSALQEIKMTEMYRLLCLCAGLLFPSHVEKTEASLHSSQSNVAGFFRRKSNEWLDKVDSGQRNYGIAVTDVDRDENLEIFVAGFSGANLVLKYDEETERLENTAAPGTPYEELMDVQGQAIGVCACDVDGDGWEEIYVLNTNQAYAGKSSYGDKLFKWRNGKYVDLFSDKVNKNLEAKGFAGRSVACIDRHGSGKYSIAVATYSQDGTGNFALIEMDDFHHGNDVEAGKIVLHNVAKEAGIDRSTGGRGIAVGPILHGNGKLDIFFGNEGNSWLGNRGENYLFKNLENGTFIDVARTHKVTDEGQNARGIALTDFNHDGLLDLAVGNWEGHHRLYIQEFNRETNERSFTNVATPDFEEPSMVRTVIAADFDNDGHIEVLLNNINDYNKPQPNRLFKVTSRGSSAQVNINKLDIGDAVESDGYGTGGATLDIDSDGQLDVILSHGEDRAQPLEVYTPQKGRSNNWIRVLPLTKYGAPARGATVILLTKAEQIQMRVIDSGSGYLCQMEPVAHFGLAADSPSAIIVKWPDGKRETIDLSESDVNRLHRIEHPDAESIRAAYKATNITTIHTNSSNHNHTEL